MCDVEGLGNARECITGAAPEVSKRHHLCKTFQDFCKKFQSFTCKPFDRNGNIRPNIPRAETLIACP
jgi:hypothetical protein